MDTNKNEMDELLKKAMQFTEGELPEPDKANYNKLHKKVAARKVNKSPWAKFFALEIKLYQAVLATATVAVICILLRPAALPQNTNVLGQPGADTATAFKGSSLKSDSFLVRNFTSSIY